MISYKNKYLKYKEKYLNLKKQLGGEPKTFTTKIVVNNNVEHPMYNLFYIDILRGFTGPFDITTLNINLLIENLESYINRHLSYLKSEEYDESVKITVFNNAFADFYDSITEIYLQSNYFIDFWQSIVDENDINIRFFSGDNLGFRNINESHFVVGLNILAGCMTKRLAQELNSMHNAAGKYFIGFDGTIHTYGISIYHCEDYMKISDLEMQRYLNDLGNENLLVKLIKIFHKNMQKCISCRTCQIIDPTNIKNKIKKFIKNVIIDKKSAKQNCYFDTAYLTQCEEIDNKCDEDNDFINWMINKINEHNLIMTENKRIKYEEKRAKDQEKQFKKDFLLNTPSGTDISTSYTQYIDIDDSFKSFIEGCNEDKLKVEIILMKDKNNTVYFNCKCGDWNIYTDAKGIQVFIFNDVVQYTDPEETYDGM